MRRGLARALGAAKFSPKPQPVPFDFGLFQLARSMGIPPWVLEGYRLDDPPTEWVIRCIEFARMEAEAK